MAAQSLGLSELQQSLDRCRRERSMHTASHDHAERVVRQVRRRLADQGGVDAVDALDRLSISERYMLAEHELTR